MQLTPVKEGTRNRKSMFREEKFACSRQRTCGGSGFVLGSEPELQAVRSEGDKASKGTMS